MSGLDLLILCGKDFDDGVVSKVRKLIREGIVKSYIANPKEVEIVEW